MQRGRFSFRPFDDARKTRPRPHPVAVSGKPLKERSLTEWSCYWCGLDSRHEVGCPELTLLIIRAGECWAVMGRHLHIAYVFDEEIAAYADYADYKTYYTRTVLIALMVRPERIRDCMCSRAIELRNQGRP